MHRVYDAYSNDLPSTLWLRINFGAIFLFYNMNTKEMYDLELLAPNINNTQENYTRFFVISNEDIVLDKSNKISIA